MEVEVFAGPESKSKIPDEDDPARGDPEDVVGEDGDSGDSKIREVVVQGEIVDRERLKGACEDDNSDGLPLCADESEGQTEKSADNILHELG